jgi:hypothetical protein
MDDSPIGARLGSETLFTEEPFIGERVGPLLHPPLGVPPELPPGWDKPAPPRPATDLPDGFTIHGEGDQGPSRLDEKPAKRRRWRQKAANQPPQPRQDRPAAARTADANWRDIGSTCLELAGIMAITTGCWLIAACLGLIVLGVCLILLGVATGLPGRE